MCGGGKHIHHIVLLPGGDALFAHAALGLCGVLAGRGALDIAVGCQGKDTLLLLDQILDVDLVLHNADLGLALVAVLVPNLDELVLQDALHLRLVLQKAGVVGDPLLQLLVLVLQLLPVQTL